VVTDSNINSYKAWDIPTRVFHWLNVLCVIVLSILGLIMLNKAAIGISGREAAIGLKTIHVLVGYVFAINLIVRIVWGFFGGRYSRWSGLLPGKNFKHEISAYRASVKNGQPQVFIGHNPMGRISVLVLVLFLTGMMVTGMIRAGTDIYYPPFGNIAANYVATDGVSPSEIKPYDETGTNADRLAEVQAFKKPIGMIHVYGAYVLWLLILIHVVAVIRAETNAEGTLISAMFSGKKHLPREPEDL
jgi:Ni/Fe-hydrogenase 1 B-type cytochrome subunit